MGLADLFSDLYSALTFTDIHAEEPAPEQQEEGEEGEKSEEEKEGGDDDKQEESQKDGDTEDGAEQEEEEQVEEEEEEEDDEPVDPKPRLEEGTCRHHADLPIIQYYHMSPPECHRPNDSSISFERALLLNWCSSIR